MTSGLQRGFDEVLDVLPNLFAALVVLLAGYVVAKVVERLLLGFLERVGADRALYTSRAGDQADRLLGERLASQAAGSVVFWVIMLGALGASASALGADALSDVVGAVYGYVARVVAAGVILVAGLAVAAAVGALVDRTLGGTPTGRVLRSAAPVLVVGVALFMALDQLEIAPQIIAITYAAIAGSIALAAALAFGLGGADVAARLLSADSERRRAARARARADIALARERHAESARRDDPTDGRGRAARGRLVALGRGRAGARERGPTRAQKVALGLGATLLLMGLLGFFADATFDTEATDTTPGGFQGDGFLGFEVNGWHNLFHLVTGAALLATAGNRRRARTGTLAFGALYALVSLIGLIDGDNVLGVLPVNAADNVLHPVLAGLTLWAGMTSSSRAYDPERERRLRAERERWREERERAAMERERLAAQQELVRWQRRRVEPAEPKPVTAGVAREDDGVHVRGAADRRAPVALTDNGFARDGQALEGVRARDRVRLGSAHGDLLPPADGVPVEPPFKPTPADGVPVEPAFEPTPADAVPVEPAVAPRWPDAIPADGAEGRPAGSRRLRGPANGHPAAEPLPATPGPASEDGEAPSGSRRLT